jgi:FMN phosphatase YigB (HAD superfamily)
MKIKAIIFDWGRTLFDSELKKEFFDAERVLSFCKDKKLILAVASLVSEHSFFGLKGREEQIENSPLRKYFSFALVTDKDKNKIFDELVKNISFKREEIMIVDDRVIRGIKYGNLRSHPTIWLKKGKFENELPNLETGEPTYTINSLLEIIDILNS